MSRIEEMTVGILGCQTTHSRVYLELFNDRMSTGESVPGGRITRLWDYDRKFAEQYQPKYPDLIISDDQAEVIESCDAILVLTDDKFGYSGIDDHLPIIRQIAAAGKAAFVDKPIANNLKDASEIVNIMRGKKPPLMSCSSFNWADCFDPVRENLDTIRPLRCAWALVGNGCSVRYGIHVASIITTCLGSDIKRVSAREWKDALWLADVEYNDGCIAQLQGPESSAYVYRIDVWGHNGHIEGTLYGEDEAGMNHQYYRQMSRFVEVVNGSPATDRDLDLPSLALTLAIRDSAQSGQPVDFQPFAVEVR